MSSNASFNDFLRKIRLGNFFKALICSALNILILGIIYLFITKFSQGFVIPLDLYMKSDPASFVVNIVAFHFLLSFLALIMTLYPTYIFAFLFERGKHKSYNAAKKGLIYYTYSAPNSDENPALSITESYIRKLLGLSLFIIWSWVVVYVYNKHQIDPRNTYLLNIIALVSTALLVLFFFHLHKIKRGKDTAKQAWWGRFADISYRWYVPYFILANAILCFGAWMFEWHLVTVIIQLIICFLLGTHLVILRTFRKNISWIKDIVNYLNLHRIMGIITVLFIIIVNTSITVAEAMNPINIILANLIAIYTIITMLFKWFLYLKYKNEDGNENFIPLGFAKLKLQGYRFIMIGLGVYLFWNAQQPNNLHELSLIDKQEKFSQKSLASFCRDYQSIRQNESTPIFYAAYGGGLKAHYWNFQILESLDQNKSFDNIVAMSGVSGGGMGIGNYSASKYLDFSASDRKGLIQKVKSSNILGIELSWFMGFDFYRSLLPIDQGIGKGRSHRSTKYYTELLKSPKLTDQLSFSEVYHSLSDGKHYPNIIFNSTAAGTKYGVVSAINNPNMFPGSINLLDIGDKTLSYFEAITTCNRFPGISPAANIPTKGYFLDGGYFENSGIMSLASFANALENEEKKLIARDTSYVPFMNQNLKLVTVSNTKLNYLQFLLRKNGLDYAEISNKEITESKKQTELGAILNGAIELDRMPHYIRSTVEEYEKEKFNIIDISLPYYININSAKSSKPDELETLMGGKLNPSIREQVATIIKESNKEIIATLKKHTPEYKIDSWGIVDPPTARILSKPVEIYMEAMMKHPYVEEQLEKLK